MPLEVIGRDDSFWWEASKAEIGRRVTEHVIGLRNEQSYRFAKYRRDLCLYGNMDMLAPLLKQGTQPLGTAEYNFNVVKSVIDTAHSKLATRASLPRFVTSGGAWNMKQKAKKLSKLVEGTFYDAQVYDKVAPLVFLFAEVCGTGFMKQVADKHKRRVVAENVFPWEIVVDDRETMHGDPRSLFQTRVVSKHTLSKLFPRLKTLLQDVSTPINAPFKSKPRADEVELMFAWHLPTFKGADDSRYVMCCGDVVLADEKHTEDSFPFSIFRWGENPVSFWGTSLVDELAALQTSLNVMTRVQRQSIKLGSAPKWIYEQGSIDPEHLDNEPGGLPVAVGASFKPSLQSFKPVSQDLENQINVLYQRAYEITGMSRISSQGTSELGPNASGAALREFYDQTSERFASVGARWESFFLDAAKKTITAALEIAEEHGTYPVKATKKNSFYTLDWNDMAGYEEDDFVMKLFSTNKITTHPAGRIQTLNELMNMKLITPQDALQVLDFPDLESTLGRLNSLTDFMDMLLEKMLEHEPIEEAYTQPEPYLLLNGRSDVALAYMVDAHDHAQLEGAPEERCDLVRKFIDDLQNLVTQGQPPPTPPAPSPEPSGAPQMPPSAPGTGTPGQ